MFYVHFQPLNKAPDVFYSALRFNIQVYVDQPKQNRPETHRNKEEKQQRSVDTAWRHQQAHRILHK